MKCLITVLVIQDKAINKINDTFCQKRHVSLIKIISLIEDVKIGGNK